MKKIFNYILALTFASALLLACNDNTVAPIDNSTNAVALEFDNRVGAQKMALGTTTCKDGFGEDFTLTKFNYFISNVALKKADGSVVKFPEQYFLIRQDETATWEPKLKDVPAADYTEISFVISVDSARTVASADNRKGILDEYAPEHAGMSWSWLSGYVFMKLEGTSPVIKPNSAGKNAFEIHVGGFKGVANNLRTVTLPLNGKATVRRDIGPTIHLVADLLKVFDGPNKIKLAEVNSVHTPAAATPIADNYTKMFVVDHVHND